MTLLWKKWMAGNDVVMKQTSFNICMPETKGVLQLLLVSPGYNSCSAKTVNLNEWVAAITLLR